VRAAVKGMPNLRPLIQALEAIGPVQSGDSAVHRHCGTLADAFISSLGNALGPRFTVEMRKGWLAVFELLSKFEPCQIDPECRNLNLEGVSTS
jgi:hypothetical protein